MKKDSYVHGQFCWVDLQTPDVEASRQFYTKLFGWTSMDVPTDMGPAYTMFRHEDATTAGMGPQPPEMTAAGAPPVWNSYVCVDDATAVEAKAKELGGTVVMPTMKVMDQGWLAFIQDPTGAHIGLWQPGSHKGAGWVNSTGGFCWNELYTTDADKAAAFYGSLFGWEFSASEMGSGTYWSCKNAGQPNGGMMVIRPEWGPVPPHWAVYFTVDSLEDSIGQAEGLGAKQLMPPTEVPEVGTFAGIADPLGTSLILIEMAAAKE